VFTPMRSSGRTRQLLLLTAVLAVPGCLLTACSGQPATRAQASSAAQARAAAGAAKAEDHAVAKPPSRKSSALALNLMTEAAQAAVLKSYQGQEIVVHWNSTATSDASSGTTFVVSEVWHFSNGKTITQTLTTSSGVSSQAYMSDPDGQSPEGVLGVTTTLVKLLETHYIISYLGVAAADNRTAQVVDAWRDNGSLAAQFWLDSATKLPLEREVFDSSSHMISQSLFNIQFGTPAPAGGLVSASTQASSWAYPIAPSKLLTFREQGWVVPPAMPGGLTLFTGGETTTTTGPVLDLAYSDGLYVVSVFEQHGKLAAKLSGWQKTKVDGQVVYETEPDQRSLTWSGHGLVYTLIADAPAQTMAAVVGKLPHDEPPGFWKRMSRGLAKLASLANPFR
jgi:sigma-E factor negative regulatory protein RseB